MALAPGARLGPYEIAAQIGVGGMGEVYQATDTNLKRPVAIKVLPESVAGDADRLARFQREAEVLARLNHPNIAQIHGLERADGHVALVMELVEGQTLAERIAQGAIPVDEALSIAKQIAEALEAAHEQGIVHRDLKPANVKVRPDGTVKVLDFGLAKALEPPGGTAGAVSNSMSPTITTPAMTQAGMILGTAAYMSPEQARGKAVDRRADIWAFGSVLFEMLTGKRAFEGEDVSVTLADVIRAEPAWSRLPSGLSPVVVTYLRRCLQKDAKDRVRDIGDVRLALEGAFDTHEGGGHRSRWSSLQPVVTVVVIAWAGVASTAWLTRGSPDAPRVTRFALDSPAGVAPLGSGVGRHVLALSPDGTRLVYWADEQLFVHDMSRLDDATPMRGTEGAREPFFSPDGQQVGFFAAEKLKRVSVSGGAPVTIADAANPWGAHWDADGMIRYGQGPQGIWQVPGTGGTPEQLFAVEEGESAHGPQLLPDGEWVLFTLRPSGVDSWNDAQIVVQSGSTRERIVLIDGGRDARYLSTGHLVYGLNGVLLTVPFDVAARMVTGGPVPMVEEVMDADVRTGAVHFSASVGGSMVYLLGAASEGDQSLFWVDQEGRQEPLPVDRGQYSSPRISPDGTRVAMAVGEPGRMNVHVYDIARGVLTQLTLESEGGRSPLWTPDGRRVVFFSDRDGGGLFSRAADGTGTVERLTTSHEEQLPRSWSADGRTLVFEQPSDAPIESDVYGLSLEGDRGPIPLLQTSGFETAPAVSPDGQWLAYTLIDVVSGSRDVYVRPFPNVEDGRWRVSTEGYAPLWSRDGRRLYFISPGRLSNSSASVMVLPVDTAPTFRPGTPQVVFELPPYYRAGTPRNLTAWDIAPDGSRFLMFNAGVASPRIIVVQNWFEELKRLVPTQ